MLKVGDKVKYISYIHGDSILNPLWQGKHGKVVGTIIDIDNEYIIVNWPICNLMNTYTEKDLEHVTGYKDLFGNLI
jgi:hypothetical protein